MATPFSNLSPTIWRLVRPYILVFALATLIFNNGQQAAYAITPDQKRALDAGILYFNTDAGTADLACSGDSSLVGSENAEKAFNYYVNQGLSPVQAAAILGNFQRESGMNPKIVQGNPPYESETVVPGAGYGLAQWTDPGRQKNLIDRARQANLPVYDLGHQLDFSWWEATNGPVIETLKTIKTIEAATKYWMDAYEKPGVPELDQRIAFAEDFLAKYGSGSGGGGPSDSTVCDTEAAGEAIGSYSLPVSKKWYVQNPEWFSKPHHDYPAADIPVPTGTSVFSMTPGKVIGTPSVGGCGRGVIVDAGGGIIFTYCHGLDAGTISGAKSGDQVQAGQLIMHSDNTGSSSGPHLHVQIKIRGQLRCPQPLLEGIAKGTIPDINSLPASGCTY